MGSRYLRGAQASGVAPSGGASSYLDARGIETVSR